MNKNKLKIITITLLIVLIAIVSFVGVYTQDKNKMKKVIKDYEYATDLGNNRTITLKLAEDNINRFSDLLNGSSYIFIPAIFFGF